ncbi:MAG: DUF2461 domain-containing protein [Planctomycetaceae bacterium]|nr:DUF2461 domain-containing protein [Planctomycetaceae bacterium]
MEFQNFEPSLFRFLKQLAKNNNRAWFQENKTRYEKEVLEPSLAFIRAFRPRLKRISEFFTAIDRRSGGSLMRVYRDTRFHGGDEPYKTNVGIQFRHEFGRDVHAPGFYVHLEPGTCFLAAGLWRPDSSILRQVREAIVENPARWRRARNEKKFQVFFALDGGSLKKCPLGFDADHPCIEDLRRTDFIAVADVNDAVTLQKMFIDHVAQAFTAARPFMRFLCDATKIPF